LNANVLINQKENTDNNESKKKQFDLVTHSISDRKSGRIPYYFIHGLLPIPSNVKKRKLIESTDKLIFSESEYLQLANSVFSWQSSVFLEVSSTTSIVFIGVSLSDTNMRRWLSWIHKNRINELELKHSYSGASTTHYWLTVAPSSVDEKAWIESSVDYLGVRIIWLDSWDQIGEALRLMLGITDI